VFSTGYTQLRPKLNSGFLFSIIQKDKFVNKVLNRCTGSSYPAISSKDLVDIKVNISRNIEEQNKIADFIGTIDKLLTLHKRKIQVLKVLKDLYLNKMFTSKHGNIQLRFKGFTEPWEQREVANFAKLHNSSRVPVTSSKRVPSPTPYYGANGIQDYVEGYTHSGEFILVAEDGANDLTNYPVKYINGEAWINNHAHVISNKHGITNTKFLIYRFRMFNYIPFLVGGSRAKLNASSLLKLKMKIPVIEEQEKISHLLYRLENMITLHNEKLNKLESLKKEYLNYLF